MKSLRLTGFGKGLEWQELARPKVQDTEVLLSVLSCGVCHSDLHIWQGYYDLAEGKRLYAKDRGLTLPITMGHEIMGQVVEFGDKVTNLAIGDSYLVYPWQGCGKCYYCLNLGENHCLNMRSLGMYQDGGYSEFVRISHPRYLVDIGKLPADTAGPYSCAGLTAYSALKKVLPIPPSESLLIIGAGGVGLMGLQILPHLCSNQVIVVDIDDEHLRVAKKFAPYITINSKKADAQAEIMELCSGGVAAVVDFVGLGMTAKLGFQSLKKNGQYINVGMFGGSFPLPIAMLAMKNITLRGSYTGSLSELKELINLLNKVKPLPIPFNHYPLSATNEILEKLEKGEIIGRCIVGMSDSSGA